MQTDRRRRRGAPRPAARVNGRRPVPETGAQSRPTLAACSLCLRVQSDAGWIDARDAIRRFRTFELDQAPRLAPAICDACRAEIDARRQQRLAA
jgi:hypothetical protein